MKKLFFYGYKNAIFVYYSVYLNRNFITLFYKLKANIPILNKKDYKEMEGFSKQYGACVRNCKGGAAHETPIEKVNGSGVITQIDRSKCIQSLLDNNYCSVCLKICPNSKLKSKMVA